MSARSFRSVFMVASCAGAALGCYLVSLRVASERASLEDVETQIVTTQRDIRLLQTEIGTRGRLAQLERWNVKVLALSAPAADQFLNGSFELAKLTQPQHKIDLQAPVVLASAPAPEPKPAPIGQESTDDSGATTTAANLLHQASLKTETREVPATAPVKLPRTGDQKSTNKPAAAAKPADKKFVDKPGLAAAKPSKTAVQKKTVDKLLAEAAKPVTKPVRIAKTDPLAPLPVKHSSKASKETAPAQ
jgi:hypothetical protein